MDMKTVKDAADILLSEGILFEDNSLPGLYLSSSISRNDLLNSLIKHFEGTEYKPYCSSFSIPSQHDWKYYILIYKVLEENYLDFNTSYELIYKLASKYYKIPIHEFAPSFSQNKQY